MIRITQLKTDYRAGKEELIAAAAQKLGLKIEDIHALWIVRKSVDARQSEIKAIYTVDVSVDKQEQILQKFSKDPSVSLKPERTYQWVGGGKTSLLFPPVIVGSGPAGLFCTLMLARHGYQPLLLERGLDVDQRCKKVQDFWEKGTLDPQCTVQFGEGGAGTFSDGKLNTQVKDKAGRKQLVLETFYEAGAPEEILYLNKPHLGTDQLVGIVKNIRKEILSLGGKVYFHAQLTDLKVEKGALKEIEINHAQWIPAQCLVLAVGHSARDTFEMLKGHGMKMEAKPFAVGVRVEHPQSMIDQVQYGRPADAALGPADYKVIAHCRNGRAVYSFCMCPGGYVVNASSEREALAVNGMSYQKRDSQNANSAIVVTVTPSDFEGSDPLAGVAFARNLERSCYQESKRVGQPGRIPIQQYQDFCLHRLSTGPGEVVPVHKGGVTYGDINRCLPEEICKSIREGMIAFGRKIKGFDRPDALLSAVESRTSSPVRLLRDESFQSSIRGIYPCGEGAGYAGGITSSAIDGIKVAEAIARESGRKV